MPPVKIASIHYSKSQTDLFVQISDNVESTQLHPGNELQVQQMTQILIWLVTGLGWQVLDFWILGKNGGINVERRLFLIITF